MYEDYMLELVCLPSPEFSTANFFFYQNAKKNQKKNKTKITKVLMVHYLFPTHLKVHIATHVRAVYVKTSF